jgi:hypothetical protein
LPYRYEATGLAIQPRRCLLDDGREVTSAYDPERHSWDLSAYRMQRVRLEFDVPLPLSTIEAVFPSAERDRPAGTLMVVARCAATRLRRGHVVSTGQLAPGAHPTTLELLQADVLGSVELTPFLLLGNDHAAQGYAAARGSRIASGRSLEVRFDILRTPTGEYLDIRYESFRAKGPPLFPHADALYRLESGESPILWLNSDHARVCQVLDDVANTGRMARARDVIYDQISHAVWTELFFRAARAVVDTGEPVFPWQEAVLAKVLPLLYAEIPDYDSRVEALVGELREDGDRELRERLDGELQQWFEVGRHATALAEELA